MKRMSALKGNTVAKVKKLNQTEKWRRTTICQADVIRELYCAPATASELSLALTLRKGVVQEVLTEMCRSNTIVSRPFYAHCSGLETLLYMVPEHAPKERLC